MGKPRRYQYEAGAAMPMVLAGGSAARTSFGNAR